MKKNKNYLIWIKDKSDGTGAAWEFDSIHECFELFNKYIGLYTDAYYKHVAFILDKNDVTVISKKGFKRNYKKWFDKNIDIILV